MKLNKLLYILPFFLTGCELDKEPYGLADLWSSADNIQMALDAAYVPFYEEEGFGRGQWWAGALSDDMVYNRKRANEDPLANFSTTVNGSGGMYDNWSLLYQVIRRSNDVLRNAPSADIAEGKKRTMLGEANFLCGFSYFYLAKRFGGLPFYDINTPTETNKPRETKEQTYKNIEAYLLAAINYFKDIDGNELWYRDDSDFGRPNLGAAYGLLAKVYAHWGKFDKCEEAAYEVIKSGKYQLDTTNGNGYAHLFSPDGEKENEVLFNLTNTDVRHKGSISSIVLLSATLTDGTGWYYFAPTKNLYNAFVEGDQRRFVTMRGNGDEFKALGKTFILDTSENGNMTDMTTGFMCTKYAAAYEKLSGWNWESGADIPLLRYADVLLLHAEAIMMNHGAGPANRDQGVSAAAESFNKVHVRAFGNDASKAISSPTFNDLVRERRCELAYEDERHYDLVRWGMAAEVYAAAVASEDPRGPRTFDPAKNNHMPLPQKEIDNSNGVLINNPAPGYSDFGPAK